MEGRIMDSDYQDMDPEAYSLMCWEVFNYGKKYGKPGEKRFIRHRGLTFTNLEHLWLCGHYHKTRGFIISADSEIRYLDGDRTNRAFDNIQIVDPVAEREAEEERFFAELEALEAGVLHPSETTAENKPHRGAACNNLTKSLEKTKQCNNLTKSLEKTKRKRKPPYCPPERVRLIGKGKAQWRKDYYKEK